MRDKRENVPTIRDLNEDDQKIYKRRLNKAYQSDDYEETKAQLVQIGHDLERINLSAARSLTEGLEETLTLHRIGLKELFGKSFSTTNIIENLNSQMGRYLRKEFGAEVSPGSLCVIGDRSANEKGHQL